MASYAPYAPQRPVGQGPAASHDASPGPLPPPKSEYRPYVATTIHETSSADEKGPPHQYVAHDSFEEEPVYGNLHSTLWNSLIYFVRYLFIVALVGALLAAPIVIYRQDWDAIDKEADEATARQEENLRFYVFCWLETFWLCLCFSHLLIQIFPYVFFGVARYVNSAHRRYWRVFRTLKWPYTLLGGVVGGFISFRAVSFSSRLTSPA